MSFSASVFEAFINRQIIEICRVVVYAGVHRYVLLDTAIFVTDLGMVQIMVDVHEKQLYRPASLKDIMIAGDYEDRSQIELQPWHLPGIPLKIGAIYEVCEAGSITSQEYLVGVFLANAQKEIVIGLNMHLDDLECSAAEPLWKYIEKLLAGGSSIRIQPMHTAA